MRHMRWERPVLETLKGDILLLDSVISFLTNLFPIFFLAILLGIGLLCVHIARFYYYLMKNNPELMSYLQGDDIYGFFKRYRVPIRSYKYFFSDKDEEDETIRYYKHYFRLLNKILLGIIITCIVLPFIISALDVP